MEWRGEGYGGREHLRLCGREHRDHERGNLRSLPEGNKGKAKDFKEVPAAEPFWSRYKPTKTRLLVKVSAVNACVNELKSQIVADLHKCVFVRIVSVGPNVEDTERVRPGALIVIFKKSGLKLRNLSRIERSEYRMIKESHILAYADF